MMIQISWLLAMQHDDNLPPGSKGWFQYYLARQPLDVEIPFIHGFLENISQFHAAARSSSLRLQRTKTAGENCIF